jgi:hypothetical protein
MPRIMPASTFHTRRGPSGRALRSLLTFALTAAALAGGCGGDSHGTTDGGVLPIANAGADQAVPVGDRVHLDGSQSRSGSGFALSYHWSLTAPAGSQATLDDATQAKPSFLADVAGSYALSLTVDDGEHTSVADQSLVTATSVSQDLQPVARPGKPRTVAVGSVVTLDGSGSGDDNGDALTYRWTLTYPSGSSAAIDSPTKVNPSFVADVAGSYEVMLIVNDGQLDSEPAYVAIVARPKPVANISGNADGWVGATTRLDGSLSSSANGTSLTYTWTLTSPQGSGSFLLSTTASSTSFLPDEVGQYHVQLVVNDGVADSAPYTFLVTAQAHPLPVAQFVASILACPHSGLCDPVATGARVGDTLLLDDRSSVDNAGTQLTYQWTATNPAGQPATLIGATSALPQLEVTAAGSYTFVLLVNDGFNTSAPAHGSVVVTVNQVPTAHIDSAPSSLTIGTIANFSGSGSDADGDPLLLQWQVAAPLGSQVATTVQLGASASFVPDVAGTYKMGLWASDGRSESPYAIVTLVAN